MTKDPAREELTPAERIALWRRHHPTEPLPASVTFERSLSFPETREFLERHDLRPFAVHMRIAGLTGAPWLRPEEASPALLEQARSFALDVVLHTLCDGSGVQPRLESRTGSEADAPADTRFLRAMLARVELSRRSLAELRADAPVIHGIKVVGPIARIEALQADPLVRGVEPGVRIPIRGVEQIVVPDPAHPGEPFGPETLARIEALDSAEVRRRLERVATEQPEECRAWTEKQEELRREGVRRRTPG